MAKASLVSNEVTREKIAELTSDYGRVFVELMGLATTCHKLKIDMAINRRLDESASTERSRIIAAIRESNESAESKYRVDALNHSFQIVQSQIDRLSGEFSGLGRKYYREVVKFGLLAHEKLMEFSDLHAEVSSLIREELGFEGNLEKMKMEQKNLDQEARKAMQDLFDRIEREYMNEV